jgi:hypothetical protein
MRQSTIARAAALQVLYRRAWAAPRRERAKAKRERRRSARRRYTYGESLSYGVRCADCGQWETGCLCL